MKYKNISSAIHNFGTSFTSYMNYVDHGYVIDELTSIHCKDQNIEVNWLTNEFQPKTLQSKRITKSIGYWRDWLPKLLLSQNVDFSSLSSLHFKWPANGRMYMVAIDNRGKEHKAYV